MADLALTIDGDLDIQNNDFVLVDGLDAIKQDLQIRLSFFQGEWFLDTRLGVPYFQKLLGEKPGLAAIRNIFQKVVLSTPGILSCSDLIINYDGYQRRVQVSFRGQATTGSFDFNEELII